MRPAVDFAGQGDAAGVDALAFDLDGGAGGAGEGEDGGRLRLSCRRAARSAWNRGRFRLRRRGSAGASKGEPWRAGGPSSQSSWKPKRVSRSARSSKKTRRRESPAGRVTASSVLGLLVAGVGGEVAGLGAVRGRGRRRRRWRGGGGRGPGASARSAGLGPGGDAGGAEPEAGEVERRGAEGEPVAREGGGAADLGAAAAVGGGEGGAAGVFVRDEVAVAGEEEGGVHAAGHGGVGEVVAFLGDGADAPVGQRGSRRERAEKAGHASTPPGDRLATAGGNAKFTRETMAARRWSR